MLLSQEEQQQVEKIAQKEAFNLIASDKVSMERSLTDYRDPEYVISVDICGMLVLCGMLHFS